MATSRIYIPKNPVWETPSLPKLHLGVVERKVVSETATALSFLFMMAMIVGAFAFLMIIGPNTWGSLQ